MTNIDRAAEVIAESITRDSAPAHEIVADLEHDGLLMPDLPGPYATGITEGPRHFGDIDRPEESFALFSVPGHPDGAAAYGGSVEITHTIVPDRRGYAPDQARALAAALLAAADYAERNHHEHE